MIGPSTAPTETAVIVDKGLILSQSVDPLVDSATGSSNYNLFQCFHCNECFSSDIERLDHRGLSHPDKLDYPEPEDFNNRLRPNRTVGKAVKVKDSDIPNPTKYP